MGWQYYAVRAALMFWFLSIVASAVLQLNVDIPYTHFFGAAEGPLYNRRFSSPQAVAVILSSTRVFQFLAVCVFMTFSKTRLNGYPVVQVVTAIAIAGLVVMDASSLAINSGFLHECNGAAGENRDNPCNDARRCCAPEVYDQVTNGCRNTGPCLPGTAVGSVGELSKSADFLWTFALNVLYVAFGIALVAVLSFLSISRGGGKGRRNKNKDDEKETTEMMMSQAEQMLLRSDLPPEETARKRK